MKNREARTETSLVAKKKLISSLTKLIIDY